MLKRKKILATIVIAGTIMFTTMITNTDAYYLTNSGKNQKTVTVQNNDEYKQAKDIKIYTTSGRSSQKDKNIKLAEILAKRLENHPARVDISDIFFQSGATFSNFRPFQENVIAYLEYANPDMYAFRGNCSYSYNQYDNKVYMTNIDYEETLQEHQQVVNEVNRIVSMIPKNIDNASKILWVNNYLVTNAQYDSAAVAAVNNNSTKGYRHAFTPYGVLLDKKGVCESYAKAFSMIMKRLDIPNYRVRSNAMRHTWNIVKVQNSWYNIDVTWNDPVGIDEDSISYSFFLKSDQGMMNNSSQRSPHYRADEDIEQTNNTDRDHNPFGKYAVKKPLFINNRFFYINNDILNKYDKTINIKEYKANENNLITKFNKAEGFKLNHNNKTYIFAFNPENKTLQMYNLANPDTPISKSTPIQNLDYLKRFTYNETGKTIPMYNHIVTNAKINGNNVIVTLLENTSEWNINFNRPKTITIPLNDNNSGNNEKPNPDDNKPNPDDNKPNPDDNSEALNRINNETDLNKLADMYNSTENQAIKNGVMNRFKELDRQYTDKYNETYDEQYANNALRVRAILRKDTDDIYQANKNYNDYVKAHNSYIATVNRYYNRQDSYENVVNAYENLKQKYNSLSKSYKEKKPISELINDIYENYYNDSESYFNWFN